MVLAEARQQLAERGRTDQAVREGVGVGGVVALFLFKFVRPINDIDRCLWIVTGDLPSAYFVTDQAREPASALKVYCKLMEEWAEAVINNKSLDDVFPVNVTPTIAHAEMLRARTIFIRDRILPTV